MDIKDIQNLIKFVAKSGAQEVKLEMEDIKITIKTGSDKPLVETTAIGQHLQNLPQPVQIQAPPVPGTTQEIKEPETTSEEDNFITIKSPIIGTFYRKAAPDKPNFIEVGKTITEGDVLCVIEAMKLFNEIESEVSGTIVKILVDDASPVEFDQPLFLINPS
jgi:acetyl-CoA carboxylase biotin carboxyl carrier protein